MVITEPCEVWHPPVQMDEILSASGCMIIYIELCEKKIFGVRYSLTWLIRGLAAGQGMLFFSPLWPEQGI